MHNRANPEKVVKMTAEIIKTGIKAIEKQVRYTKSVFYKNINEVENLRQEQPTGVMGLIGR